MKAKQFIPRMGGVNLLRLMVMQLLVLLAWLMPLQLLAKNVEDTYRYQVMLNGSNTISIKVPVYDEDGIDHWVSNGNLKVTWKDDAGTEHTETLLWWRKDENSHDNDDSDLWCKFKTTAGGSIEVTQGNSSKHFTLTSGDGELRRLVYENPDGNTYDIAAVWRLPYNLLGKELKFSWDVKCDYTNGLAWDTQYSISLSNSTVAVPDAQGIVYPQLTSASISYSEDGKLEMPWFIANSSLQKAEYQFMTDNGKLVTYSLPTDQNNGTIYLDATLPHKNFRVVVDYKDDNNYDIKGVASESQDLSMLHVPINFKATPLLDLKASVKLQWGIEYPGTNDLMDTDFFEIQRSLTGEEADFVTIGSETFDIKTLKYEFIDSTLVNTITAEQLKDGSLDHLTYRIRRMATQTWGWENNSTAVKDSCVVDDLHLTRFANYTAKWEDERAFTVRVSWNYANEYGAVWDERAKMKLRVISTNRSDEQVDSTIYTLTAQDLEARYKIVSLTRPCVNYHIDMYVEQGTSPIGIQDDTDYFQIHSAEDWDQFVEKVKAAQNTKDVNALLMADITVSKMVGESESIPYRGNFNGNGHTLTFNPNIENEEYIAPFRFVSNATIRNLHTAGSVSTTKKFASGMVGRAVSGNVIIENGLSSMSITGRAGGDTTNGGFVAVVGPTTNAIIRNCQFDGAFKGFYGHSNGGFVGWCDGKVLIENCMFTPSDIRTDYDGCATWARVRPNVGKLTVVNSYCTMEYTSEHPGFFVINNTADWDSFVHKVKDAGGNSDVNAVLAADISIDKITPMSIGYRGTFDGGGHTLNLNNIDEGTTYYIAPFAKVKDVTIKNLNVTGSIKGGNHTSGLIGLIDGKPTVTLERVCVSAKVTSTQDHVGGFVGHAHDANVNVTDCLFDGTLTATGESYGGAIMGWGHNGTWTLHRVYECGSYPNIVHPSIGYWYDSAGDGAIHNWGTNAKSTNCISVHDWGEMASANHRNVKDPNRVIAAMNQEQEGTWQIKKEEALPVMPSNDLIGLSTKADVGKAHYLLGSHWQIVGDSASVAPRFIVNQLADMDIASLPDFHHESIGKVDKTLKTETRQSSVVLTWKTDGNPIDYFQVMRREKGKTDWEMIATGIDQKSYEDKTVSALADYEYMVRGVNDCEGVSFTETEIKEGACKHTGKLEGYVRFNDGTGVPGIMVDIVSGDAKVQVTTDEKGYFMAEDLSYMKQKSITYNVTPVSTAGITLERESYAVTFTDSINYREVHEFTITNGLKFTAFVMYDGTSIPVKGARFKVNGELMHNTQNGYVETDFEGRCQFMVLGDIRNIIQVVMDGHTFTNDGYYKSEQGVILTDKVDQAYFYDATTVKLTGRVVGGKDQGNLPLDNNLSRNNLGQNLTMVMALEGDNTSWLVYDNLHPEQSKRDVTFNHPAGGGHKTMVEMQRKRMIVKPDSVTGEYMLMLPPVRWKVQQVYCEGYPTLFQDGMVSEVIDLTDCLEPKTQTHKGTYTDADGNNVYQPTETYHARYNRIYHAPVEITYRQRGYDTFDYFGDRYYQAQTIGGDKVTVPLAYPKVAGYTDYVNPFDTYTHTPKLTPQDASHEKSGSQSYEKLFDDNPNTKWCVVSKTNGWWVNFKADKLVSISTLNLTTGDDTKTYDGRNPKAMRLYGRATEDDEWTILMETNDAEMGAYNLKTYNFDVPDHKFYQFFRLEILSTTWGNIGTYEGWEIQLSELSLTCRGNEDSTPDDDHGAEPIMKNVDYTFGYPVFSLERKYPIDISVVERYPWNNSASSTKVDLVKIGGGKVTVHNGMKNGLHQEVVYLDSLGQGVFQLQADQTTRLLTGKDALQTVTMTLEQDGTTYEATPLKGYVLNMFATGSAKDVMADGLPLLVDILRDPPGGGSSATLSKGSKLKYTYTLDMKLKAGLALSWTSGTKLENFQGAVAAPEGVGSANGIINAADTEKVLDFEYAFTMEGKRAFSYTMNVTEDISTSSAATMTGADADLYIGMVQNIVVTPMSTIRAIPDSLYQLMLGRLGGGSIGIVNDKYGTLVHIAEGRDQNGRLFHLVRDESIAYGPKVQSQFVHSQKHIQTELLPKQLMELRSLMFTGTPEEAQSQANITGKPVYRSLVDADSENFGVVNTNADTIFYYTSTMPEMEGMNYVIHLPAGTTTQPEDEVATRCQIIYAWMNMIAENEREKLNANEYVANYEVDGGAKLTYGETFESDYTISNYYHLPGIISGNYFDDSYSDKLLAGSAVIGVKVASKLLSSLWGKLNTSAKAGSTERSDSKNPAFETRVAFYGKTFKFSILPVMDYDVKDVSGESKTFSRKESFTIAMDGKSHLSFDLYRTQTDTTFVKSSNLLDVFTNQNFSDGVDYVMEYLARDNDLKNVRYSRGFVYRTRGGATCNPWEDERRTLIYQSGTILDERTKKICNPKITFDRQSVSGVAYGDPARFKMYLTNDSEEPQLVSGSLLMNTLYLDQQSNPNGAKVLVDGAPLNSNGLSMALAPGQMLEKTIEIYAGSEFDYEGLTFEIASSSDYSHTVNSAKVDVHYLRQAGAVNISSPNDKWVMNTDAQYNEKRGWFMPVTIDGFNKYQHNFDHIEFQYKESQRGDEYWTNLCSYYADSTLMAQANGVCEMIPENDNIHTEFYGEGTVMEKAYDLRAVLYCRDGNSFLTTSSKVMSGVKDTRRPQLFGTPEPKDGVINLGDNIIFNFSEDIEYNYLNRITNFEVKGEVNNDRVSESVSIQFDGNSSVESEAQRNFSGKDLTIDLMIKPEQTGSDMPLFSHGDNGKTLQLWLTKDNQLKAVVNGESFTSTKTIDPAGFTQVAIVIKKAVNEKWITENGQLKLNTEALKKDSLTFYNGGVAMGTFALSESYIGTGPLIFGRTNETNRKKSQFYKGRMMEARLWYRALTGGLLGTTYGSKRLTGYEMGLVDYYPMNEGTGDYALDKTQGANAKLYNAGWAIPRGMSLHLDWEDHGLALHEDALNRTAEQDYTLMFWFKTDSEGRGVLISNGAGRKDEIGAQNQFCLGFEADKLIYRTHGMAVEVPGSYSDNDWHHYAMTVNRSSGVANIYMDHVLRATFPADSLGGISGGYPLIGAARYTEQLADGKVATIDTRNWLRGNIDELCFFEQALPLSLITSYSKKSPHGDEKGLLTYLSFDRQERVKDNDLVLVAYPYSKKIYLDDMGNIRYQKDPVTQQPTSAPMYDYSFADDVPVETVMAHIDASEAAPVVPYEELKNLSFSFVGKDNQVLVSIDEQTSRINRRNIYVTIRDIEDKNGNAMASPATACYYVTSSALQWVTNRKTETVSYGQDESTIILALSNKSSTSHTYTIQNCPTWLTLDTYSDVIGPKDIITLVATVNKNLNVGSYDEILYLTDEEGVSEPLYLNLTVQGEMPEWAWNVNSDLLMSSMNIVGQVYLNDEIDIDPRDIIGAFDSNNVCHGFAHIDYSAQTGESSLYLTLYDNVSSGRELSFKLWEFDTGCELQLSVSINGGALSPTISFKNGEVLGTETPVRFVGGSKFVQTFDLKSGWNWVSFNVESEELFNLHKLLDGLPWKDGDVLTDMNSDVALTYINGQWLSTDALSDIFLTPKRAYAIKVQEDIKFPIAGFIIKQKDMRTIELEQGWNGIGYTPMLNLPVETALSDYYDKAQAGDVIKSQKEFAYFTITGGVGRWRGSLQYMKPGEGYMMLRKAATKTSFLYPFYEPNSTFIDEWASIQSSVAYAPKRCTMTVSATVEGIELEEGDHLVAFADGELCGEAVYNKTDDSSENLYLSIGGDEQKPLWFAVERDGELIASTSEVMTFSANAVVGSPEEPTTISFVHSNKENGRWYTTSGVLLPKRPTNKGVYIYNGKKIVIK